MVCKGEDKMKKRLYVAYGSNLNMGQMAGRCPHAELYDFGRIEGYELQFKGSPMNAYATIAKKGGASVPVAIWKLTEEDEAHLDRYEGYPTHYFKKDILVKCGEQELTAMVYVMNLAMKHGIPSPRYYGTLLEGYEDCKFDTQVLDSAVVDSAKKCYPFQAMEMEKYVEKLLGNYKDACKAGADVDFEYWGNIQM